MSADTSSRPPTAGFRLKKRPERRIALSTIELWKANKSALAAAGIGSCELRYAYSEEQFSFVAQFKHAVPQGPLGFTLPRLKKEELVAAGWEQFLLTLRIEDSGELWIRIRARYATDEVTLDVDQQVLRTVGAGMGVGQDELRYTNSRDGVEVQGTLRDLLKMKLKDGVPRFCRKGDTVRDLPVEGIVAVLARYAKEVCTQLRHPLSSTGSIPILRE